MKALLSRVGLSQGKTAQATGARQVRQGADPTLGALVRLMIKKGLITAEELHQELDGD